MASAPADTSDEIQALLDDRWRQMSAADKADIVATLYHDCTRMALAGIRSEHGETDAETTAFHLAARRYGLALARQAYNR